MNPVSFLFMWVSKWTLHLLKRLLPLHLFSSLPLPYIKCFYMSLFELSFLCFFFLLCANPIQFKSIVLFKVLITENKSSKFVHIQVYMEFFSAFCIFIYMLEFSIPLHTHTQIPARILAKISSST